MRSVCIQHILAVVPLVPLKNKYLFSFLFWSFTVNLNELKHDLLSVDDASPSLNDIGPELEGKKFLEDGGNHAVGSLLPDDEDELLAGIMDGFEVDWLPNLVDDSEEYDLFGSGGGLELESGPQENLRVGVSNLSLSDGGVGNGVGHFTLTNGVGTIVGEHPLGEHPSRTLFVRNINSNVEDAELRTLFEVLLTSKKKSCFLNRFLGVVLFTNFSIY